VPEPSRPFGFPSRGVTQCDVSYAADSLLREGFRPTIEKIRAKIGKGSPNTINPLLDAWWKTLSARLDSGPAALHRLPESVAHVAEALWLQALDEGRRRARTELKSSERIAETKEQNLEVRSHVLTLREGELDSRLRDRDLTIDELNLRLRELTGALRKEQATRELRQQRVFAREAKASAKVRRPNTKVAIRPPLVPKRKKELKRALSLRPSTKRKSSKRTKGNASGGRKPRGSRAARRK
jgi:hypothetical protein